MKIVGNEARLKNRERDLLGVDSNRELVARLRCSERLDDLCTDLQFMQIAENELPPTAMCPIPLAGRVITPYSGELDGLKRDIELATRIGGQVLVHQTDVYLAALNRSQD